MTGQWRARQYQEGDTLTLRVDCSTDAATYTATQRVSNADAVEAAKDQLVRDIARSRRVSLPRTVKLEVWG